MSGEVATAADAKNEGAPRATASEIAALTVDTCAYFLATDARYALCLNMKSAVVCLLYPDDVVDLIP